jgi:hypothetical protein
VNTFTIFVDELTLTTEDKTLTPNQILELAQLNPQTHYLIQIEGKHQESFEKDPTKILHIHEKMKFISVSREPAPVA